MKVFYFVLNVLQALFLIVWSFLWMNLATLTALLTFSDRLPLSMARWGYSPAIVKFALARFKVEPLPDLDWSKPHIFVMNHQSMLDIPAAFAAIPANLRFVAKKVLQYVPVLGWYMMATGMIFVDRSNRAQAVGSLKRAAEKIRNGKSIIAYPEGTRSRDGRILPFKKGVFVLALEAGVPIVPVAIEGSGKVLPSDGFRLRPGDVRLKVGRPIPTAGRTPEQRDELMREVRHALIGLHLEIGGPGGDLDDAIAPAGIEGIRRAG
ncbi:MAG TPA: lysophospholipid acyltransferase family protein [Myxococcaceae bacterium]|nr:lysophospholipid acyltransferase family protein [Myxococcaceae bacterium]